MAIKENALPVSQSIGSGDYLRKVSSGGVSQQVPFSDVKDAVVTIDPAIDSESENPVQNKAIAAALDAAGTQTQQAIATAIQTEVEDRNSAISQAISTEASNRNQAIASAIQTETADRTAAIHEAISDEVTDRNAAIASAIDDEEAARNTAISEAVAAEAQAREAADEELNQSKANTDGNYPDMTVGNADQLISSIYTEDQTPYNFRQSGGGLSIGDREIDKIVGGTIAWNQLARELSTEYWSGRGNESGISFSDGVFSCTATAQGGGVIDRTGYRGRRIANHVYLQSATIWLESGTGVFRFRTMGGYGDLDCNVTSTPTAFSHMRKAPDDGNLDITIMDRRTENFTKMYVKNIVVLDLTAMFGSTIADYIYSLEQATAGAGVAWFRKLFPKPYYAYDAGQLMSVNTGSHVMNGFNQWDEEWRLGYYSASTGVFVPNTPGTTLANTNSIKVIRGANYYVKHVGFDLVIFEYDANDNFLGRLSLGATSAYTPTDGTDHINFHCPSYGTIYNHDICINLTKTTGTPKNGDYVPYNGHTYALDSTKTLRGVPKLDSNNKLYYEDGDTYEANGTVTRRRVVINGTSFISSSITSIADNGTNTRFWLAPGSGAYAKQHGTVLCNLLNPVVGNLNTNYNSYVVGVYDDPSSSGSYPQSFVCVVPSSVCGTTKESILSWLTTSGIQFEMTRNTPTTETAQPYTNPQTVSDWGTEEYVDAAVQEGDRDVAVPVGHVTDYLANLRDKLQNLPDAANADGTYLVQQTSGQMALLAYTPGANIPAAPTTDGTYTLQAVVSGGVATYSWVSS